MYILLGLLSLPNILTPTMSCILWYVHESEIHIFHIRLNKEKWSILLFISLLLQLVSCEVSDERLWMTTEDNCNVSFLSDSQVSASRNSTLTTSQEFYENHFYSANSSVSCIDNGSDHCSLYYCVNENCRYIKKSPTHTLQ